MKPKDKKAFFVFIVFLVVISTLSPFVRDLLILNPWRQLVGVPFLSNDSGSDPRQSPGQANLPPEQPPGALVLGDMCQGYNDDRDYLYDLDTNIFTKPDGTQSFEIKRRSDSKVFRQSLAGERFFEDHSAGLLNVTYQITESCGGVDIVYNVANTTPAPLLLPDFFIQGVNQSKTNGKYLQTKQWGILTEAVGSGPYYQIPYPNTETYSPVMVGVNDDVSIGSSFNYPYLDYKHAITPYLWWFSDGSVGHSYNLQWPANLFGGQIATIPAGTSRTYTISLRAAPKRNWILTLDPYKKYFNFLYAGAKQNHTKDLRPVKGVFGSYYEFQNNLTNPRGYVQRLYNGQTYQRLDQAGWGAEASWIIDQMQDLGYRRSMIWTPSGVYGPQAVTCSNCDFPSQFASHWTGNLGSTLPELQRFSQAGMTLGFWWGHAGSVPSPNTWPPLNLQVANLANPVHRDFLEDEVTLAKDLGVRSIGLDAVIEMSVIDRWNWFDTMKQIIPGVQLIHEVGGPDLLHAKIDNFYTDTYNTGGQTGGTIGGPHVLSWYLNPQSEIWAGVSSPVPGATLPELTARAAELTKWGYTFVDWGGVNVSQISTTVSQCLDHIDNDGDGKTDWPYDEGCSDERDDGEINSTGTLGNTGVIPPGGTGGSGGGSGNWGGGWGGGGGTGGIGGGEILTREEILRQIEELMAIVRMLQAQLAGQSSFTFNTNLTIGKSGLEVSRLQIFLESKGYLKLPSGVSYGYFGALTKNALAKFQRENRIYPASGYFGPVTRAFINKL